MRWTMALSLLLALSPLSGCAATKALIRGDDLSAISRGRGLALSRCAICHAVGNETSSSRADAPPFRLLTNKYSAQSLGWELETISSAGHYGMPPLRTSSSERADLVAYITSLWP